MIDLEHHDVTVASEFDAFTCVASVLSKMYCGRQGIEEDIHPQCVLQPVSLQDVVMNHMGNEFFFEGHQGDTVRAAASETRKCLFLCKLQMLGFLLSAQGAVIPEDALWGRL